MGSIIETGAQPNSEMEAYAKSCRQSFAADSLEDLLETLNRETGHNGWVSRRGVFLIALRNELRNRSLDLSAVDDLAHFPGNRRYELVGDRLRYAEQTA